MARLTLSTALAALALSLPLSAQTRLLRFPDVHGDKLAFCYAGDLWLAPSTGGTAARLTAHPGLELFPRFSPDGAWIAFTGQCDGDEQVYVMPAAGGAPRQLTHYPARGPLPQRWGYDNQVYGWTRDGSAVLFRSMRDGWDLTDTRLFTVALTGGLPVALPMPVSGGGDLSPDGLQAVYSPLTRDFRTWKRYQGGWAQDLYVFDFGSSKIEPVAHHPRTERDPMWIGAKIWFVSDRDGTLNLYSFDLASKQVEQATHSQHWDVRWASRGEHGEIVYESGGELRLFDTTTREDRAITIRVPDDGVASRPAQAAVEGDIEEFALSPKGERALFVARGDIFSAPAEKGATRNLTRTPGTHERLAAWSPDGRWVAYVSDASGEEELWRVAQDGSGVPEQLTSGGSERRTGLSWSPDAKQIAFADKSGRLHLLDVESRAVRLVAQDRAGQMGDYSWSPDSRWLAFSLGEPTGLRRVHLWSAADGQLTAVTDALFNASEPVWDPQGRYLWYLSDREFAPQLDLLEWNFTVNRTTGVYALALRRDVPHPFPPESDEVALEPPADKDAASAPLAAPADAAPAADAQADAQAEAQTEAQAEAQTDAKADAKKTDWAAAPLTIDLEGLAQRVARVPLTADNYSGLSVNKQALFLMRRDAVYYGRESASKPELVAFSFEERKLSTLVEDCTGYELGREGGKLIARSGGSFGIWDAGPKGKDSKKAVATGGLELERVPRAEWSNIFQAVWRRYRDYFYAPNMHGYDWEALRAQYQPLLEHVAHRADLNYLIGEMVAELNVGHAYVSGGDWELPARARVALFGGRLEFDPAAGRYRLARILRGQNEEQRYRSPLTEVGVDVKAGEWVLAIDGVELRADDDPYRLLRHKASRPVELTVNAAPTLEGARKLVFQPTDSEENLFYLQHVLARREIVERLSGGRLAYLHIPDMGPDGMREFIKWYYGQVRKQGLIVDDRNNGGGNVSQMIIERLRRVLTGTGFARNDQFTGTYPNVVFDGPMACLINENSASDGDIFPWMFQTLKLGPVIGKRSWGGVVGITDRGTLIDGGTVHVPEFGHADARGQWQVEGHGVDPDIVVDNDPTSVIAGRDPQLERAIQELLKTLGSAPRQLPSRPADPVKTR